MTITADVFEFKIASDKADTLIAASQVAILDRFSSKGESYSIHQWRETDKGELEFSYAKSSKK